MFAGPPETLCVDELALRTNLALVQGLVAQAASVHVDAVGNARSIQDDAQLIAQNRAQYQVVQPDALPERSGNTGPNIVKYALETSHPKGQKLYTRVGINKQAKFQRNCAKYNSADQAQTDFLAQGGPRRDRMGLDPDGDGYACAWDPRPFRAAVQN